MQNITEDKTIPVQPNPLTKATNQSASQPATARQLIERSPTSKNQRRHTWLRVMLIGFIIVCFIFVIIEIVILNNAKHLIE